MWNNFQKILEKRVNSKQNLKNDKQLIIGTVRDVLREMFGCVGDKKVETVDFNDGELFLKIKDSVWRSELKLRKKSVVRKINRKLNQNVLRDIKIID
jgi:hypothetical protein